MKLQFTSFGALVLASLCAHLLLGALILQQRLRAAAPRPPAPTPLQINTWSAKELQSLMQKTPATVAAPPAAAQTAPVAAQPPAAVATAVPAQPQLPRPAAVRPQQQTEATNTGRAAPEPGQPATTTAAVETPAGTKPASTEPISTEPASTAPISTEPASTAPISTAPLDLDAILQQTQRYTAQRPLTAAELNSLSQPKTADTEPSERQRKERAARLTKSADMPADVLEVLADGTQRIKIGDNCALAAPGADLRKDIHSIKVVPCGEQNRAASRDALFEQIMSGIGKHR